MLSSPIVDGAARAERVHAAPPPDRLALHAQKRRLVRVEGPAVIAGHVMHVGRVGDDQQVEALLRHRTADAADALLYSSGVKSRLGSAMPGSLDAGETLELQTGFSGRNSVKRNVRAATCRHC
jgi:hypothetical protein